MFDHNLLLKRRDKNKGRFSKANFLHQFAEDEIIFRAQAISESYNNILELGSRDDLFEKKLRKIISFNSYLKIKEIESSNLESKKFDLIISNLSFHHLNDFVSAVKIMKSALNDNGVLLFSIFGNDTLLDLKRKFAEIEDKNNNVAYQRIIPMIRDQDIVNILNMSGFKEIIVDGESQEVIYQNFDKLISDIRHMSENNIMSSVKKMIDKKTCREIKSNYSKEFSVKFDIIFATAIKSDGGR